MTMETYEDVKKTLKTHGAELKTIFAIFLVFLGLKLIGINPFADLSYLWITSPLWIPVALFLIIITL